MGMLFIIIGGLILVFLMALFRCPDGCNCTSCALDYIERHKVEVMAREAREYAAALKLYAKCDREHAARARYSDDD